MTHPRGPWDDPPEVPPAWAVIASTLILLAFVVWAASGAPLPVGYGR